MKIIIPLAGLGTRLRPHTFTKPKPLVNVAGKPVLAHILDKLEGVSVEEIIFITGYLGDQIQSYVSANYSFPARYIEQKEMLGQAHAIALARDYVKGPVSIIFVDTIFDADLSVLEKLPDDGLLYVKEVEDPRRFGVAVLRDGYIERLVEKPKEPVSNLAVVGVYYFSSAEWLMSAVETLMARDIKTGGEYYLADAIQLMIDEGARLRASTIDVWEDCGKLETLLHTNRYLLEKTGGTDYKNHTSIVIPPVHIAPGSKLENCIIGPYVSVAANVTIQNSIIRNSIINERSRIENAVLTGSVIGADATVHGSFNTLNVGDSSEIRFEECE